MNSHFLAALLIPAILCTVSVLYLLQRFRRDRRMLPLVGLFCLAMGIFLLVLDTVLVALIHGPSHVPEYLLFNRLVSDIGFAGRWALTVYLFLGTGVGISIYLLAVNMMKKFNKHR